MDDDLRSSERAWRAAPDDPLAHERWIEARFRAGIAVGHEELDARLHPAREWTLPVPGDLALTLPDGGDWRGQALPNLPLLTPAGRGPIVIPDGSDAATIAALSAANLPAGTALDLTLSMDDDEHAEQLAALAGARWTHLRLSPLASPCDALLEHVAALPRLCSLWLSGDMGEALTRDDLRPLASAAALTSLELHMTDVEPGALHAAAGPGLRTLILSELSDEPPDGQVVDAELRALVRAAPGLRRLDLQASSRAAGDRGLRALGGARELTALALPECPALTDAGVRALEALQLTELTLDAPLLTDVVAPILAALPLQRLQLRAPGLSPRGLATVVTTPAAAVFLILDRLAHLPALGALGARLRELTLMLRADDTEADLAPLSSLVELPLLRVWFARSGAPLGDALLRRLVPCRGLRRLELQHVPVVGPEGLRALSAVPLEELRLWSTGLPADETCARWSQALPELAGHPTLRSLTLTHCPGCSDHLLPTLARIPNLTALGLNGCPGVTPQGVAALREANAGRLSVAFSPHRPL